MNALCSTYLPIILAASKRKAARLIDLLDEESACITNPIADPFGDSCWRSSWVYASLAVLYGEDGDRYATVVENEGVSIQDARRFIVFFAEHCASDDGFNVWKSNQEYSRDQLIPLMYLLACMHKYDNVGEHANAARAIVKNLREHESHARSLSSGDGGVIGRNIGYLINRLCDQYGIVYRWKTRPAWLAAAHVVAVLNIAWNVAHAVQIELDLADKKETDSSRIASDANELFLKQAFAAALSFNAQTARFEGSGQGVSVPIGNETFEISLDQAVDGYSVFNALAALSQLRVAAGQVSGDLSSWRGKFRNMANLGWGPAFDIIVGDSGMDAADEASNWRTSRELDNDIVHSQRPAKFIGANSVFPSTAESGQKTLDGLILSALASLW